MYKLFFFLNIIIILFLNRYIYRCCSDVGSYTSMPAYITQLELIKSIRAWFTKYIVFLPGVSLFQINKIIQNYGLIGAVLISNIQKFYSTFRFYSATVQTSKRMSL